LQLGFRFDLPGVSEEDAAVEFLVFVLLVPLPANKSVLPSRLVRRSGKKELTFDLRSVVCDL
jgi:hypothetical protein